MVFTLDEMEKMLDEIADVFPRELFNHLNGGIILKPEVKLNPAGKNQDLYILGEYHADRTLGRYITIYYGSMAIIYGHLSRPQMLESLTKTLKHEFRHHLESLAGDKSLEIKDKQYLEDYMRRNAR